MSPAAIGELVVQAGAGLVPILLAFLDGGQQGRPRDIGEFGPGCDLAALDRLGAVIVLAEQWAMRSDLRGGVFASDRQRPLVTEVNSPANLVQPALIAVPCSPHPWR